MEKKPVPRAEETAIRKTPVVTIAEDPTPRNPYLARDMRVHGYSVRALVGNVSFSEMLFLCLRGELPNRQERKLLDDALTALSAIGPRHPAVRMAMYASSSKTVHQNLLPVALSVLSGEHLGAEECAQAMKFLQRHASEDPRTCADRLLAETSDAPTDGKIAPGFGSRFNGRDPLPAHFLSRLARRTNAGAYTTWANRFAKRLARKRMGALSTGLAAAVFLDLGFTEAQACGAFQMAVIPHVLALASEMAAKGPKAMPFMPDSSYHIEPTEPTDG